jgi:hypothetical protein
MNIYEKLEKARKIIRDKHVSKDGNGYNFDYFTPTMVSNIVAEVCEEVKITCHTDLKRDSEGLFQQLTVLDLEKPSDIIVTNLATAMCDMKNANASQQMGATDTYSERYVKMKVFEIKDNSLDPDSHQSHDKVKSVTPANNNNEL